MDGKGMARMKAVPRILSAAEIERHRWLEFIGFLKLVKGTFFVALGFGLLRMLHHDIYILALQVVVPAPVSTRDASVICTVSVRVNRTAIIATCSKI